MVVSVQSPADVANVALVRMGFKLRVGTLFDGSEHAQDVLEIYGQTRDEMLREFDYDFAQRSVALTLLKSAPPGGYFPPNLWNPAANPPIGWAFEYAFPTDAIKIRTIKPQPLFIVNADPQPYDFTEGNDSLLTPAQRVILTNVGSAVAVYTGRVTDPTTWDVAFTDALAARLAALLGPLLMPESTKITLPIATAEQAMSELEQR